MNRRQFLGQSGLATLGWLVRHVTPVQAQSTLPNIIFIMADDLGAYQQTRIQTPHLDSLAAEGMRHARNVTNSVLLYPEDVTLAQHLQLLRYYTIGIGKWGIGDIDNSGMPLLKGFNHWFGYFDHGHAHNYYPEFLWRNNKMDWIYANLEAQHQIYAPDLLTAEAVNFIQTTPQRPFFLYLPYTLPHANNELYNLTGDGLQVPNDAPYTNETTWPPLERKFAAMVTRLDGYVGQILQSIKARQLEQDTIIFFTSDNGAHQEGGHQAKFFQSSGILRGIKRDLYEGGIRVPMIVRWSNKIKANTVGDHPWALWDVWATLLDILGQNQPSDGLSIKPTLLGETQTPREYFYWAFQEGVFKEAVRLGNWKGVRNERCNTELYHLGDDIGENRNLATIQPQVLKQIEEIMAQFWLESARQCLYLPMINNVK